MKSILNIRKLSPTTSFLKSKTYFSTSTLLQQEKHSSSTEFIPQFSHDPHVKDFDHYKELYKESIDNPDRFWENIAKKEFYWKKTWKKVSEYNFDINKGPINVKWFIGAQTNVAYNALDRHVENGNGDQIAYYWEGNELGEQNQITYRELLEKSNQIANLLKKYGVKKGDVVAVYMPMVLELPATLLACARIGAVHNVVFGGFSAENLAKRMMDSKCKILVTADGVYRGKKPIQLKQNADEAIKICKQNGHEINKCIMYKRHDNIPFNWNDKLDTLMNEELMIQSKTCDPAFVDSEHPLFILYTSGSTGAPKGILHTTGGYMVYTATTMKYTFDLHKGDVFWCGADIGWVTGHSYIVYSPLLNGATSVMYEGLPTYPHEGRLWQIIEKYNVNQFYTAPTVIRGLKQYGDEPVKKYDRSSLRVLGSVGEPINPDAWKWYQEVVGESRTAVVDTWWQTETGGHCITPLPTVPQKPGSASFPFFGVDIGLVDDHGKEIKDKNAEGNLVIKKPWPGIMRTIHGDHDRFQKTYFTEFPGFYIPGDGCKRDEDGFYYITGRIDDVMNISGHRISTSEIESAIMSHPDINESAVIAVPHQITGESIYAFVTPKSNVEWNDDLKKSIAQHVTKVYGPIGKPSVIHWAPGLPKTRSGKIMRRILRKIACGETKEFGDTSSLAEPDIVDKLIELKGQ